MGVVRTLRTEELSRDVQSLASHDDDLLAVQQLLGHSTGQPAKEVTLAIYRDLSHPAISKLFHSSLAVSSCRIRGPLNRTSSGPRNPTGRETHDILKGRHLALLHVEMRRQISQR
jgi:hypothetical protein